MHIPLRLVAFLLVSATFIACSQSTAPSANDQEVTKVSLSTSSVEIPYVINSAEVAGAATIVTSAQVKPVDPSGIGTVEGYLSTEERGVLLSTYFTSVHGDNFPV